MPSFSPFFNEDPQARLYQCRAGEKAQWIRWLALYVTDPVQSSAPHMVPWGLSEVIREFKTMIKFCTLLRMAQIQTEIP